MASRSGVRAPEGFHRIVRDFQPELRRWREVKRRPVQGNSQNDRILRGPDFNRHKRVYADSFPATSAASGSGIQQAPGMRLGRHAESIGPMEWTNHFQMGRRTASRWSARSWDGPHREFTMRFCRLLLSFAARFKKARALVMRFLRHGGIYRSDMSSHLINLVPGSRLPVGSGPGYRTRRKKHALPIVRDEFRPAIPQRVGRHHCPSPLHRPHQNKAIAAPEGSIYY